MKREVIQDFLNLPGVAGVALMDGRSRPYFFGVDQALNFQQKEALAQGIQQVVDTTPSGFGSFEFQFTGHQVYIYKLQHGIILLVLAEEKLIKANYRTAVILLQNELQQDAANAIATFRLIAGNVTLTQQNRWTAKSGFPKPSTTQPNRLIPPAPVSQNGSQTTARPGQPPPPPRPTAPVAKTSPDIPPVVPLSTPLSEPPAAPASGPELPPEPFTPKETLEALNQISQLTTHYLGTIVVANYWKTTRPAGDWLTQFQVDRSAQFSFKAANPNPIPTLNPEELQWVRDWIAAFVDRCSKVIRDFNDMLKQSVLDDRQKTLLPPH